MYEDWRASCQAIFQGANGRIGKSVGQWLEQGEGEPSATSEW